MVTFYIFNHRFKRSMLEITPRISFDLDWNQVDPIQKVKHLAGVPFKIAAGKKNYDIIRAYENRGKFFSQKVIDVFSQFVDMSDKCYPIQIEGVEQPYYVIFNLDAYPFLNRDEKTFLYDPLYFCIEAPLPLLGIEDTLLIMVSEEVKNALLKNKITNIELIESFGCTQEEYEEIKRTKFQPEVHVFRDK